LIVLLLASGWSAQPIQAQDTTSDTTRLRSAAQWRDWFVQRRFGADPWVFLGPESRAIEGCPVLEKLSIASSDSLGVTLRLVDDRERPIVIRSQCTIRYERFRGQPTHGQLADGRVLWKVIVKYGNDQSIKKSE
jgi:hypothetical protein